MAAVKSMFKTQVLFFGLEMIFDFRPSNTHLSNPWKKLTVREHFEPMALGKPPKSWITRAHPGHTGSYPKQILSNCSRGTDFLL
mmetsp:Transcript_31731/g.66376  ORF Transcript_31731/g.66376 Transcript_31731/m.66376 type:complete len:84 (-) Transcript_31731:84-335(-)